MTRHLFIIKVHGDVQLGTLARTSEVAWIKAARIVGTPAQSLRREQGWECVPVTVTERTKDH